MKMMNLVCAVIGHKYEWSGPIRVREKESKTKHVIQLLYPHLCKRCGKFHVINVTAKNNQRFSA